MEEIRMKPILRKISLIVLLVALISLPMSLLAATDNGQLDAVLVIDASGSMKETDPNKLGLEGVKLFIDMMAATGNQVGLVTYGSEVDATYPMVAVNTQEDKEKIKTFVDGLSRDLEYTDITAGLSKAVEMENQRDTSLGNKPLIIVFTDGNNAIAGVKGRNYQQIDAKLAQILDKAKGAGYPIYTIGLNDNGKLNEAYLKNISDETGAIAFATKDPNELPDILTQIFAAHSNLKVQNLGSFQGTGDFEEVAINIPNDNVLEANISATASGTVEFKLADPNGQDISIPSSDASLHESQSYHLLKLSKPMAGDWKLYVKGTQGDQINIELVYNYDIEVTLDQMATSFSKGDELPVSAYLSVQGSPIDDEALYQNGKGTLIVKDKQSGTETRVDMKVNNQRFETSYDLKDEGEFEISVLVEDASYQRMSSTVTIQVGKSAVGTNQTTNKNEEEKSNPISPLVWVGLGIGVLVLVAILLAIKKLQAARRPLVGQMVVELRDNTTGKLTPPQYKKLSVFQGKVSLHALLQFAPELKAAEQIIFKAEAGDKVLLINHSNYAIEKSGRAVKAEGGIELKKGDRFTINMADCGQTVQIEYLL